MVRTTSQIVVLWHPADLPSPGSEVKRIFPREEVEKAVFTDVLSGFLVGVSLLRGIPKSLFQFNDPLTGLTELRKAAIFIFTIYHGKRIEIKINRGSVQETQTRAFSCPR